MEDAQPVRCSRQGALCAVQGGTEISDMSGSGLVKKGKVIVPQTASCKVKWGVVGLGAVAPETSSGPRLPVSVPMPQKSRRNMMVAPSRVREKKSSRAQLQQNEQAPLPGSSMADLCEEDKDKISKLLQHVMQLTAENERLSNENESLRNEAAAELQTRTELQSKNQELVTEVGSLRKKLTHALELLRAYQSKMQEMQQAITYSDRSLISQTFVAAPPQDLQWELKPAHPSAPAAQTQDDQGPSQSPSIDKEVDDASEPKVSSAFGGAVAALNSTSAVIRKHSALASSSSTSDAPSSSHAESVRCHAMSAAGCLASQIPAVTHQSPTPTEEANHQSHDRLIAALSEARAISTSATQYKGHIPSTAPRAAGAAVASTRHPEQVAIALPLRASQSGVSAMLPSQTTPRPSPPPPAPFAAPDAPRAQLGDLSIPAALEFNREGDSMSGCTPETTASRVPDRLPSRAETSAAKTVPKSMSTAEASRCAAAFVPTEGESTVDASQRAADIENKGKRGLSDDRGWAEGGTEDRSSRAPRKSVTEVSDSSSDSDEEECWHNQSQGHDTAGAASNLQGGMPHREQTRKSVGLVQTSAILNAAMVEDAVLAAPETPSSEQDQSRGPDAVGRHETSQYEQFSGGEPGMRGRGEQENSAGDVVVVVEQSGAAGEKKQVASEGGADLDSMKTALKKIRTLREGDGKPEGDLPGEVSEGNGTCAEMLRESKDGKIDADLLEKQKQPSPLWTRTNCRDGPDAQQAAKDHNRLQRLAVHEDEDAESVAGRHAADEVEAGPRRRVEQTGELRRVGRKGTVVGDEEDASEPGGECRGVGADCAVATQTEESTREEWGAAPEGRLKRHQRGDGVGADGAWIVGGGGHYDSGLVELVDALDSLMEVPGLQRRNGDAGVDSYGCVEMIGGESKREVLVEAMDAIEEVEGLLRARDKEGRTGWDARTLGVEAAVVTQPWRRAMSERRELTNGREARRDSTAGLKATGEGQSDSEELKGFGWAVVEEMEAGRSKPARGGKVLAKRGADAKRREAMQAEEALAVMALLQAVR